MLTSTANEDIRTSFWPRVREFAVPASMIETATARRLAGDWAGACAAAGFDVDLNFRAVARARGTEFASRVRADLRALAPDLLRWHMPRIAPDGLLRPGLTLTLARYDTHDGPVHLVARTAPAWADAGQRISLALWSRSTADAVRHPHPRPNRRYRLDLHRHLWDAGRVGELGGRAGVGDVWGPSEGDYAWGPSGGGSGSGQAGIGDGWGPWGTGYGRDQAGTGDGLVPWGTGGGQNPASTGNGQDQTGSHDDLGPRGTGGGQDPAGTGTGQGRAGTGDGRSQVRIGRAQPQAVSGETRVGVVSGAGSGDRQPPPDETELALAVPYGCAVGRWVPEARVLLGAEGRAFGRVLVRLGGRSRLVLAVGADDDLVRTVPAPTDGSAATLPVLPDAATWFLPDLELLRTGAIEADRLHPLVAAALAPDHTATGPPRTPAGPGQPRLVECRGTRHRIGLVDGVLVPLDHDPDEIRREELLVALTGTPLPCLQAIDEAHRRPHCLDGVRERLAHGDTAGALAVVEALLGPEALLRTGPLRDELEAAALRRITYGLFRAGLSGPNPDRFTPSSPAHDSRSRRRHPRRTTAR